MAPALLGSVVVPLLLLPGLSGSVAVAQTQPAGASLPPSLQLTLPNLAADNRRATFTVRATRGQFEIREIVGDNVLWSRTYGSTTETMHEVSYRVICMTPCQTQATPGQLELWAVDWSAGSPEIKKKVFLYPGDNPLTVRTGRNWIYGTGLAGLIVGGLVGGLATLKYLRPGTSTVLSPGGYVDEPNPPSKAALGTALVGWGVFVAGGVMALVGNSWLTRDDDRSLSPQPAASPQSVANQ